MQSHEAVCLLKTGDRDGNVSITLYLAIASRSALPRLGCGAPNVPCALERPDRSRGRVPLGTEFASLIELDVPVVAQHTRLDSRQVENALMTTIACLSG